MRILSALTGMTVGGLVSFVLICFLVIWEDKTDPQGFNYFLGPLLLFVLIVGMVCGLILGLFWDTLRRWRQEKDRRVSPKAQDKKQDVSLWPPGE